MAVTFTQAQIDAFKQALIDRQGATEIGFENMTTRFGTLKEAEEFLAFMERNLDTRAASPQRTRFAATSKGV